MKYTNKHNLPQVLVDALTKDRYTVDGEESGDYSATDLVAPIQQVTLKKRHKENLKVKDVIDDFWAFMGSIAHNVLEEAWHNESGAKIEERIYAKFLDRMVSGKLDCYLNGKIIDFKTCKVYKILKGDYLEWETQLNIYAHLCRKQGLPVDSLEIIAIIFNWNENDTYKTGYPQCPFEILSMRLWSEEECETYIMGRVESLKSAAELPEDVLADTFPCSNRDMWKNVKDYAIVKNGSVDGRAYRKYDDETDAWEFYWQMKSKDDYHVVTRYTERRRCLRYCDVSHICVQNKREFEKETGTELAEEPEKPLF